MAAPIEFIRSLGTDKVAHSGQSINADRIMLNHMAHPRPPLSRAACCMRPRRADRAVDVLLAGEDFFSHLTAVQRVLDSWGVEQPLSMAGLFHSIYGTEGFQAGCPAGFDVASSLQLFDLHSCLRWLTRQPRPIQDFSLDIDRRDEVRAVIGERAEFIAYCNCVMVRAIVITMLS